MNVTITRTESAHLTPGVTFARVAEADQTLRAAALHAPHGGCYHKTWVTLGLEGHTLSFRIDLQHLDTAPFAGIIAEAFDFLRNAQEVADELADVAMRRKVFILRGFLVAAEMFGAADATGL